MMYALSLYCGFGTLMFILGFALSDHPFIACAVFLTGLIVTFWAGIMGFMHSYAPERH